MAAILFTYDKQKLFNGIANRSLVLARTLKRPELQLSDEMFNYIKVMFCQAGRNVLKKIGGHTKTIKVPYIQTELVQNVPVANAINFTLMVHEDTEQGVVVPLIDAAILHYIGAYSLEGWLRDNGVQPIDNTEDLLQEIKRATEYGNKTKQTYRYF